MNKVEMKFLRERLMEPIEDAINEYGDGLVDIELNFNEFEAVVRSIVTDPASLRIWEQGANEIKANGGVLSTGAFDINAAMYWFGRATFNQSVVNALKVMLDDKLK